MDPESSAAGVKIRFTAGLNLSRLANRRRSAEDLVMFSSVEKQT